MNRNQRKTVLAILLISLVALLAAETPATCDNPMPASYDEEVTVKPLLWNDDPQHLENNSGYEICGLYLVDSPTTQVGTVYAAHNSKRIFIKIVMDTGYSIEPGSFKRNFDWSNDGCREHMGDGAVVAKGDSIFMNIARDHDEGDFFKLILELIEDSGNDSAKAPVDFDTQLKLVLAGDDAWTS